MVKVFFNKENLTSWQYLDLDLNDPFFNIYLEILKGFSKALLLSRL